MATSGPQSLLDRREIDNSSNIVRDRLTRHRSPARSPQRLSYTSDDEECLAARVPQPYRTSFSAVLPPSRARRDRSRSTSPASSLKGSERSRSKSPGGRRSQQKHVTYDNRVVIRESGTEDSQYINLSDKDLNETSGHFSANSSLFSTDTSNMSQTSSQGVGRDYSSELRELSQQIVREYSSPSESERKDIASSQIPAQARACTPNGNMKSNSQKHRFEESPRNPAIKISDEYEHDRSISYRVAIKNQYSNEVQQQADALIKKDESNLNEKKTAEPKKSDSLERHNSHSMDNLEESSRLTPAKRSISNSIGNFFRRLSPHLGRRSKKGSLSNASSQSLSHTDDPDAPFDHAASNNSLSRGKFRRSFLKLFGKPKSKKGKSGFHDDDDSMDRSFENRPPAVSESSVRSPPPVSSVYMKSIEQSSRSDKDMYHKFKDRRSGEATPQLKPQAVKAHIRVPSPDKEEASNMRPQDSREKAEPPSSLDVRVVPKSVKSLQTSVISSMSGDESIGECSLDPYGTGSEPSLLSQSSASKQVVSSQNSKDGLSLNAVSPVVASGNSHHDSPAANRDSSQGLGDLTFGPQIGDLADFVPPESTRSPSYLRISSALSGYGHYSRYSAYKGIEKRSPYSSTLSLRSSRSDLTSPLSPEMPIGKIPNFQSPTNYPPIQKINYLSQNGTNDSVEGNGVQKCTLITNGAPSETDQVQVNGANGHVIDLVDGFKTSGDNTKDAEYFLNLTQTEENRMLSLCSQCEAELLSDNLPEEASGKLRAAVGKANLLLSQKFRQFRDLCQQHMTPELEGKRTKYQDLQGFWEMVRLQVDDVDEMFTEIDLMRQNGWREIKISSRRSSSSSSPKSGSLSVSNTSTPSHTPGSRRRNIKVKDTPESSPERTQKAKQAARAREDARKKMLAEKRAAMKQKAQQGKDDVEIFVSDNSKSNSQNHSSGTEV